MTQFLYQLIDQSDIQSSYFMVATILSPVRVPARKHTQTQTQTHIHKQANANREEDRNVCGQSKCSADGYTPSYSEHVCTSLTVLCTHAYVVAIRSNQPHARTAPGPLTAVSLLLVSVRCCLFKGAQFDVLTVVN